MYASVVRRVSIRIGLLQSSSRYVKNAVKNLEKWMVKEGRKLTKKAPTPMSSMYKSEVDVSPELSPEMANFYQSKVGVLRWIIEMGRLDITTEVSMLVAHMAAPREGHLTAVIHVFAYLKNKHNARLIYDPSYPQIETSDFKNEEDWKAFYSKVKEAIPPNDPPARGSSVLIRIYVDADHAGNMVTRRSRTGYVQFVNNAVVNWFSKKQGSIKTSTFGSEFVALKTAMEANRGLRYKLIMMRVLIDGSYYVFCDSQSVIENSSRPESLLKKKSNAIAYYAVREPCAMKEIHCYVKTDDNAADIMTKVLLSGERRDTLV
jgi:hypothetical protein